ncbi:MSCRAMM family protein [Anaerovorax odorimutans]|uniref:MSCRAMM family protein n=1 Tax=Anaerovorax odorimutans TaxID=109327 RepID=UPI000420B460|nr:carboxypeptidase-like regulatory domain-containing protein [Anaerovorax odorimutans]
MDRDIYELKESEDFYLSEYQEKTVDLQLIKVHPLYSSLLTGRVFNKSCNSIANATIEVFDFNLNPLCHTLTDPFGFYKFKDMLPGEYKLIASADNYLASKSESVIIHSGCNNILDFNLRCNPIVQKGILYGVVYDNYKNTPIKNVKITLVYKDCKTKIAATTLTNEKGQYLIYNLLPNNYIIIATHPNYLPCESIDIKIGKKEMSLMNLNLIQDNTIATSTISGTINYHGNFAIGIPVFLYEIDNQSVYKLIQIQITNRDGIYLFSSVPPGKYMINAKLQIGDEIFDELVIEKNQKIKKIHKL